MPGNNLARKEKGKEKRGSGTLRGKSSAAALCRAQPTKAALGAELCVLFAVSGQDVRAADCDPFVKKGQSPFLTVSGTADFAVPETVYSAVPAAAASQVTGLPTAAMAK